MKITADPEHEVCIETFFNFQLLNMGLAQEVDILGTIHVNYGDFLMRADGCLVLEVALSESS
jgi:hypothetical protein